MTTSFHFLTMTLFQKYLIEARRSFVDGSFHHFTTIRFQFETIMLNQKPVSAFASFSGKSAVTTLSGLSEGGLSEVDLSEGGLFEGSLSEVVFSEGSLSEIVLSEGSLSEIVLSEGSLAEVVLFEVFLFEGSLSEVVLAEVVLSEVGLFEVVFSEGGSFKSDVLARLRARLSSASSRSSSL